MRSPFRKVRVSGGWVAPIRYRILYGVLRIEGLDDEVDEDRAMTKGIQTLLRRNKPCAFNGAAPRGFVFKIAISGKGSRKI
jgi:hypothetical protein